MRARHACNETRVAPHGQLKLQRFKITLAYDGTGLVGWQRQASGTSIQGLLESALRHLDRRDVIVTGAGRTDAGVHALGQVASFSLDRAITCDRLVRALNAQLPGFVRVLVADLAADTFHARFDARIKTYSYRIWNADVISPFERHYAWHLRGALDRYRMAVAARLVEGRHDFAAFRAAGGPTRSTERVVLSSRVHGRPEGLHDNRSDGGPEGSHDSFGVNGRPTSVQESCRAGLPPSHASADRRSLGGVPNAAPALGGLGGVPNAAPALGGLGGRQACDPALIVYHISGSGFLRHMVRNVVGSLVEIGRGRRSIEWMREVLATRDRAQAGPTAPPEGLVLVAVEYDDIKSQL